MIDRKKKSILLIDDNPVNNNLVASILMPQGYEIYIVDNGRSGLELAAELIPDIILLDIMMSDINGFQVCKHLKSKTSTRNIPVIFITTDSATETQIKSFQMGGSDFITKPIVDVVLIERIKHQIKLSEHSQWLETINRYHELAEHFSDLGFWACQNVSGPSTFTASKQFCEILKPHQNTDCREARFDLGVFNNIIEASNHTALTNQLKKRWAACVKDGGMFDEVCHYPLYNGKKFIRIWAQFTKETSGCINAFGAIQDITQVINTENELAALKTKFAEITTRQQMIEANTQLAHELNQPLAAINLNVSYIRQLIESTPAADNHKMREALSDIESDVARANNIVLNTRRILKKEPVAIKTFDLNQLLEETIRIFNRDLLQKNISLFYDPKEDTCMIRSNRTGLQQVIVNLLKNAIEAFASMKIESPVIEVQIVRHNKEIHILISDNGPGIPEAEKDSVFRQYYTSKKGNTGMGLGISKALMQEVDGDIQLVPPPPGKSTCFKVIVRK
ncbi:MAG: hybrid sensor histidine kinase/response regulator [Kiritimatiellae bacterium]|nr:hybrid sensor histidine kinase/response regulator [Kiritimatiellia bacterium]